MPDLAQDLRSYVDRLAELAEQHASAATTVDELIPADIGIASQHHRRRRLLHGRSSWWIMSIAAAIVTAVVAITLSGHSSDGPDADTRVRTTAGTTATTMDPGLRRTNGMVPGQAVIDGVADKLRTFGPDGVEIDSDALQTPWPWSEPGSSDLDGGWVVCGLDGHLTWAPKRRDPVRLLESAPDCDLNGLQVVDSPDGPTAIYSSGTYESERSPTELHAVVLATGRDRVLDLPDRLPRSGTGGHVVGPWQAPSWSASTGRLLVRDEDVFRLFDLETGEEMSIAHIDAAGVIDVVLSPDATTIAMVRLETIQKGELAVVDLRTGAREYQETFDTGPDGMNRQTLEGVRIAYDGNTVAIGGLHNLERGFIVLLDLLSGSRRTLNVAGTPL